ncbi:hypothetical protein OAW57_00240 [Flavobacteriales bacterium]|nr:hypothetical protein [Flavobacteriales bacterium]
MNAPRLLRLSIVGFWTLFWGLSVVDKVIPDVHPFWVGKDFFALFVKFFASLGLKDPLFATVALAGVSGLEALSFVLYVIAAVHVVRQTQDRANTWFFRAVLASMTLFALFSIADQTFGDRFQLLEHGLFWLVLLASWGMFHMLPEQPTGETPRFMATPGARWALGTGAVLTLLATWSIRSFSHDSMHLAATPVEAVEVVEHVWKFDFPFLADKDTWEATVDKFKTLRPELDITYIYTGPSELNTKKKTHLLLYVFTREKVEME